MKRRDGSKKVIIFKSRKMNGIDRKNNDIGYELDNCLPCCSYCNWMKSDLSVEDFINHINKIYINLNKIKELITEK